MRIYIAGPLSTTEDGEERSPSKIVTDYIQNIHAMCMVAARVRKRGHAPFIPGLDFLIGVVVGDWEEQDYRGVGMAFLEVCDAVLVVARSKGVDAEVERAKELNIPIYFMGKRGGISVKEIPNV